MREDLCSHRVSHHLAGIRIFGFFINTDYSYNSFIVRYCYEQIFKRKQVNIFHTMYIMSAREDYIVNSKRQYPKKPFRIYGSMVSIWNFRVNFYI